MIQNNNNKYILAGQFSIHLGTAAGVSKHGSISKCSAWSGRSSPYVIWGSWLYQHQSPLWTAHSRDHCRQIKGLDTCRSNPGHLWLNWAASVLPLSHDGRTTTNPHNSLYVLHLFIYFQHEARCSEHLEWENHSGWVLSWWREFPVNPSRSSDGTYWVAARCVTEAFSTTWAVYIEDCENWWSSGCCGSVAEHWWLKSEVSWVWLLACWPFHFPLFLPLN